MGERSEKLFELASQYTPGGVHSPVRSLAQVDSQPIFFSYAEGAYLYDVEGKNYIDFCQSFGPHILGHCPLPVVRVLKEQVTKAISFGACHPKEVELCHLILKAYPFMDKVRLVNSGTEALMTALRVARGSTDRPKFVKFDGCYHGHSDALLVKAGSGVAHLSESSSRGVPQSLVSDTLICRYDDLSTLEKTFKDHGNEIAAVVLEPIAANHGLWLPSRDQLQSIVDMAKSSGALVIFDEVITGFRIGLSGATGLYDLKPDLVTLGKIIGGGLPLAAVVGSEAIMSSLAPLGQVYQAGTLSGNPIATAAGCAVLETLFDENPYEKLETQTTEFVRELKKVLAQTGPFQVENTASLFWIHLDNPSEAFPVNLSNKAKQRYGEFFRRALKEGIYLPPSPFEVAFLSTAHTDTILQQTLEKLGRCLA